MFMFGSSSKSPGSPSWIAKPRRNDTAAFSDTARAQNGDASLTRSAIDLAAAGKTTIAEAIATTSGLDDPLQEPRRAAAGEPESEELTDAILSAHAS